MAKTPPPRKEQVRLSQSGRLIITLLYLQCHLSFVLRTPARHLLFPIRTTCWSPPKKTPSSVQSEKKKIEFISRHQREADVW